MSIKVTVRGNIAADAEFVKGKEGKSDFVSFIVIGNNSWFNSETNEYVKREKQTFRCVVFQSGTNKHAENVLNSLKKGNHVIVTGDLESSAWTSEKGAVGVNLSVKVDDVSVSLRQGTATFNRTTGTGDNNAFVDNGPTAQGFGANQAPAQQGFNQAPAQAQQGFNHAPAQQGFNQAPAQAQQGFNQAPAQAQQGFNQAPAQAQQGFNQAPAPAPQGFGQ